MFGQLEDVEARYEELTSLMGSPDVAGDPRRYSEVAREHASLTPTVRAWQAYQQCQQEIESSKELLGDDDPDIREMAKLELEEQTLSLIHISEPTRPY